MFNKKWLILFIAAFLGLFVLTHIPQDRMPEAAGMFHLDKLMHVVAYGILAVLFFMSFKQKSKPALWFLSVTVLMTLGALDEYTQTFVGRSASFADWLADAAGILAAAVLTRSVKEKQTKVTDTSG